MANSKTQLINFLMTWLFLTEAKGPRNHTCMGLVPTEFWKANEWRHIVQVAVLYTLMVLNWRSLQKLPGNFHRIGELFVPETKI